MGLNEQSAKALGLAFQSTAAAGVSLILSATSCVFTKAMCVGAAGLAGWFLVYDSATVPADGAGQTPIFAVPVNAATPGGLSTVDTTPYPHRCVNGCVLVYSSTGPYTQTTNVNNAQFMTGQVGIDL